MINEIAPTNCPAPLKQPRFSWLMPNRTLSGKRHSVSSEQRNAGTAADASPSTDMNNGWQFWINHVPSQALLKLISTVWLSTCWQVTSEFWFVPFCLYEKRERKRNRLLLKTRLATRQSLTDPIVSYLGNSVHLEWQTVIVEYPWPWIRIRRLSPRPKK